MFLKCPLLLALVVVLLAVTVSAEAPLKSGPYPASGWRPQQSFNLPSEQFPANIFEQEQQQDEFPQTADFEVSKERVDYVGQIQGNTLLPANQPQSSYLPPNNNNNGQESQDEDNAFPLGQGLPGLASPQFLNEQQQVFSRPETQPQQRNFRPQTQQNFRPQTQQQQQNFRPALQARQKNVRSQTRLQQQHQNFRPSFQARQTNFRSQAQPQQPNFRPQTQLQQNFNTQEQQYTETQEQNLNQPQGNQQQGQGFFSSFQSSSVGKPAQQYGAPGISSGQINIVYPDPRKLENIDEPNYTAIEALNAAVDAYNQAQTKKISTESGQADGVEEEEAANDNGYQTTTARTTTSMASTKSYPLNRAPARSQQGQYYILGSDNELQRVMFTTSQDEQEARTNGFTAQLKYSPAGEIRDPLFKYNERGQLVRILK